MLGLYTGMIAQLVIPLATAFGFLFGSGGPSVPTVVAQVAGPTSESRTETDAALQSVRLTESALDAKGVARQQLGRVHERQLAHIERLRRRRASWNRDRKLKAKRAEAHATGVKLARVEKDIRQLRRQLERQRRALLRAIDDEIADGPSATRRVALVKTRRKVAAHLRPKPKTIRLPDVQLNRLADPEELMEQAALIRRAEEKLLREERKLEKRADRYQRVAKLKQKRQRDVELGELDPSDVRRVTGRTSDPSSGSRGGASAEPGASDPSGGGAPASDAEDSSGGFENEPDDFVSTSVVLSEVVEPGTIDALKRAGRTGDAESRAEAAERARRDVASKLRKLRAQRQQIERRARELRKR